MNLRTNISQVTALAKTEKDAVKLIANTLIDLAADHPKKAFIFFLVNLWAWSLAIQHLAELKSLIELIPFIGK